MPTINDTPGAHTIIGSNIDDRITGNDGADTIRGAQLLSDFATSRAK